MATCGEMYPLWNEYWCDHCQDYHSCGDFPWLEPECCNPEVIQPPHPYAGWEVVANNDFEFYVIKHEEDGEVSEHRGHSNPYPDIEIVTARKHT